MQKYRRLAAILIVIVFQYGLIHAAHRVILRRNVTLLKHDVRLHKTVLSNVSRPTIRSITSTPRAPVVIFASCAHAHIAPFLTCSEQDVFCGGHTFEQHIAITDAQLIERLQSGANISAATKFIDYPIAVAAVRDSLRAHTHCIAEWLVSKSQEMKCIYRHEQSIGYGFRSGGLHLPHMKYLYHSCVVLQKRADSFVVLTAYPLALKVQYRKNTNN